MKQITSEKDFNELINDEKLSLIDFYADWCAPCQMIKPILEKLDSKYDNVNIGKVNVDNLPQIAGKFGVMGIPTLIFFKSGNQVETIVGLRSEDDLSNIIENHS